MHTTAKRLLLLVLTLVLLSATSLAVGPLAEMRTKYDLVFEPVRGLSPQLAVATQVLAWARGIIIDVIWIRAENLKREGRYFELVQLADWACKLAPRFPQVWDFNAWNLAYNVSCTVDWFPDRWAWVRSGIELLRDQGIPLNPDSSRLYESLSFMLFHKIGEQDDYAHFFYKEQWGLMMHEVLGGPGDAETLQRVQNAPRTREELLADPEVRRLADACATAGFDIVTDFWPWWDRVQSVPAKVTELAAAPENAAAVAKITDYARSRRLREDYKLEPERMLRLMDIYGPLDWRSPYPHAVYWAHVGLEQLAAKQVRVMDMVDEFGLPTPYTRESMDLHFGDKERLYEWDRVQLERLVYFSLQSLVTRGGVVFDPNGHMLAESSTDYRFAKPLLRVMQRAKETWGPRYQAGLYQAIQNLLMRGVAEFHFMGDNAASVKYYELLKADYPQIVLDRDYDEYLEWQIRDFTSSMTFAQCRVLVRGLLVRAYLFLAGGDDDKATALEAEARYIADHFEPGERDSMRGLIRLEEIRESVLMSFLTGTYNVPTEMLDNLKDRIGQDKVRVVLAKAEALRRGLPQTEKVEDRLMRDPDLLIRPK